MFCIVYINEDKLDNIKLTDSNFFVLIDFDKTITTPDSKDSWGILTNPKFIDSKLNEDVMKLEKKYFPIEADYTIDAKVKFAYMEEWFYSTMDLFFKYGLTNDILLDCTKFSNIKLRDGITNFFEYLWINNIPIIVLSAGIGNVIVELLKINNCYYDNVHVVSNFIKFENGNMVKFTDNMIHSCNKSIDRIPLELRNKLQSFDYILLFGDLIEDLNMVHKDDLAKTVSFGFLEINVKNNLNLYKDNFDVVLTDSSSFYPVKVIVEKLR